MNDEELFRRLGGLTRKEMLYDLKRAQKLVGKGISEKLAKYVRKKIDETRALISKGQFDRATELLTDFQSFEKKYAKRCKSVLIKEGRELIGELESKGSDLIRDARIQAENGNFDKAEHLLERVYREFRPFDISDKARKVLIEVKKQKARGS
jgi:capsule polysaccharide export protein KpsE/RkpR